MSVQIAFLKKVQEELENRNMSRRELGRLSKVSHATLTGWFAGSQPGLYNAMAVARVLDISLDYFMGGRNKVHRKLHPIKYDQICEFLESLSDRDLDVVWAVLHLMDSLNLLKQMHKNDIERIIETEFEGEEGNDRGKANS